MDRCLAYVLVVGTGWKRQDGWDGWLGLGTMNTKKNARAYNLNQQNNEQKTETKELSKSTA